ncbi:hypothetical protein AAGG74_17865 [Bacillus mexicanus]|uniref:hypothetical protein n=1 Tax=Bacillus mexicanus TaxID=2834415 RepID=UPI003D22AE82
MELKKEKGAVIYGKKLTKEVAMGYIYRGMMLTPDLPPETANAAMRILWNMLPDVTTQSDVLTFTRFVLSKMIFGKEAAIYVEQSVNELFDSVSLEDAEDYFKNFVSLLVR